MRFRPLIAAFLATALLATAQPARADDTLRRILTVGGGYFLGREAGSRVQHDRSGQLVGGLAGAAAAYALTQPRRRRQPEYRNYPPQREPRRWQPAGQGYWRQPGNDVESSASGYWGPPPSTNQRVIRQTVTTTTTTVTIVGPDRTYPIGGCPY